MKYKLSEVLTDYNTTLRCYNQGFIQDFLVGVGKMVCVKPHPVGGGR